MPNSTTNHRNLRYCADVTMTLHFFFVKYQPTRPVLSLPNRGGQAAVGPAGAAAIECPRQIAPGLFWPHPLTRRTNVRSDLAAWGPDRDSFFVPGPLIR